MHEVSLLQSVLRIALERMSEAGAQRIVGVSLRIGQLSGVDVNAMRFAFDAVTAGTPADSAVLDLSVVPLAGVCRACGHENRPDGLFVPCSVCGSRDVRWEQGAELELTSLEVA